MIYSQNCVKDLVKLETFENMLDLAIHRNVGFSTDSMKHLLKQKQTTTLTA